MRDLYPDDSMLFETPEQPWERTRFFCLKMPSAAARKRRAVLSLATSGPARVRGADNGVQEGPYGMKDAARRCKRLSRFNAGSGAVWRVRRVPRGVRSKAAEQASDSAGAE